MVINEETRNIKLTLSAACYDRLSHDSDIFEITRSRLIETVILEYCRCAEKFSKVNKNEKLDKIYKIASGGEDILFFRTILRLLIDSEHRRIYTESEKYNWTITSKARTALKLDTLSVNETNNFISEILEEYATMNNASRERILLYDKIAELETAIYGGREITYKTPHGTIKRMLPYKIITDPDSQYSYLIGQSVTEDGPGKIGPARIFSMKNISSFATNYKLDAKAIDDYIFGKNFVYLWTDETDIEIGLTKDGERNFRLLFNNRPKCVAKADDYDVNGFRIYKFRCTEFQAEVYFRSFGKEAKVISPATLVEEMKKFHSEALEVYSE